MTATLSVVDVDSVPPSAVVDLLCATFPAMTPERFEWKHRDGPWGPSRGWAAVDSDGNLLGVRLMVPWMIAHRDRTILGARAMDGAVAERARGKGVFSALVRHEMAEWLAADQWHVLYSTSVPASREAYRKLGWTILPYLAARVYPVAPSLAKTRDVPPADVAGAPNDADGRLETAWSPAALAWRFEPRSGHLYRAIQLRQADLPHGLVYRVEHRRGLPVVVATHTAGPPRVVRQLLGVAARRHRSPIVVVPASTTTLPGPSKALRSGTTVSLWACGTDGRLPDPRERESWLLDGADLEGVL